MDELSIDRPRVLLFTETYPNLGGEEAFLEVEVRILSEKVDLVLIPAVLRDGQMATLPAGVNTELGLATYLANPLHLFFGLVKALGTLDTYRELVKFNFRALNPRNSTGVLLRGGRMFATRSWVRRYLRRSGRVIAYSWWSSPSGLGVARAAADFGVPCIARAHGYDLYPEQDKLGRIPFQRTTIDKFDAVYSVSNAGAKYLRQEYPSSTGRIKVAHLGIEGPEEPGLPSGDGVFRILSCSSAIPLKRLELLASGVRNLYEEHPELEFTWTHIGDGPSLRAIREIVQIDELLESRCIFLGNMTPRDVRLFLARNPVDVFVNVSSSEGLPVTLMEAASFGIPMMVSNISGNSEIVNNQNGRLLSPHLLVEDIAKELYLVSCLVDSERDQVRKAARTTWQALFTARKNYTDFADELDHIWRNN